MLSPLQVRGLLVIATVAVFAPVFRAEFIHYDDDVYVTANPQIQRGMQWTSVRWAWTTFAGSNWHPLTWLSHALVCHWWGLNPTAHHAANVVLHVGSTLLLFEALYLATSNAGASSLAAALFALHPLHVESVAWVSERKDVLSTLFWMLTVLLYFRYCRRPSPARYFLVLGSFLLGLLSKPMLVTVPFVLLLLDYWPLNRWPGNQRAAVGPTANGDERRQAPGPASPRLRLVLEKLPFFLLSAAFSAIAYWAQQRDHSVVPVGSLSLALRLKNALVVAVLYLQQALWPVRMSAWYPYPPAGVPLIQALAALLLLGFITVVVVRQRGRRPYLLVGWFWYLGTLVPVIGLIQVGTQRMADRYTYVPLIGIFLLLAWGWRELVERSGAARRWCLAGTIAVLAALAGLSVRQAGYWHDSIRLAEHALAVTEENFLAHNILGIALAAQANPAAEQHFRRSVQLNPDFAHGRNNLGLYLLQQGRRREAALHLEAALRLAPSLAMAQGNYGSLLAEEGKLAAAIVHFRRARDLDPGNPGAHCNLGLAYGRNGQCIEARACFAAALQIDPTNGEALVGLAEVEQALGHDAQAQVLLQEALQQRPAWPRAALALAWIRATSRTDALRDGPAAVRIAESVLRLNGRSARTLDVLAAALAEAGRFAEAQNAARAALQAAQETGSHLAEAIRERQRCYAGQRPFREHPRATAADR